MDARQFRAETTKQPKIALHTMLDFTVMQMGKITHEKGYSKQLH